MSDEPGFTTAPARYARGMVAVHPIRTGTGYASRASLLCRHLNARWSGREGAYIMSPTKAAKLERLFAEGYDATIFGKLIHPGERLPRD